MIFSVKPKIVIGENSLDIVGELGCKKIYLITDPFILKSKMIDKVINKLPKGSDYKIFGNIKPDPTIELINEGVEELEIYDPDLIIAIGGGSAIDAAKAMIYSLHEKNICKAKFIAIPTTAGTGSEVTNFAIVTVGTEKKVLIEDFMLPDYAVLVAEFTKSVPAAITADTGMDVLTHALEAYVSKNSNLFTDTLSERVIKIVFESLPVVVEDGYRMSYRKNMMEASCMAGIAFTNAGLGINHSLAHILGGKYHISHGRLNAILLPNVLKYNIEHSEIVKDKLNKLSKNLGLNNELELIKKIEAMNDKFNIPKKLSGLGRIDETDFYNSIEEMAEIALNDRCTPTNPSVVTKINLVNILRDTFK